MPSSSNVIPLAPSSRFGCLLYRGWEIDWDDGAGQWPSGIWLFWPEGRPPDGDACRWAESLEEAKQEIDMEVGL